MKNNYIHTYTSKTRTPLYIEKKRAASNTLAISFYLMETFSILLLTVGQIRLEDAYSLVLAGKLDEKKKNELRPFSW